MAGKARNIFTKNYYICRKVHSVNEAENKQGQQRDLSEMRDSTKS